MRLRRRNVLGLVAGSLTLTGCSGSTSTGSDTTPTETPTPTATPIPWNFTEQQKEDLQAEGILAEELPTKPCGPGETEIGSLTEGSETEVSLKGTVVGMDLVDETFVISDGTGAARMGLTAQPKVGQCMIVEGTVGGCTGCDEDVFWINRPSYEPA